MDDDQDKDNSMPAEAAEEKNGSAGDMIIPGERELEDKRREEFAQMVVSGVKPFDAHRKLYPKWNKGPAREASRSYLKDEDIKARIKYLRREARKEVTKGKGEINLQSVIKTCREVIDTSDSVPQRLKAIEVLNKLGVFDGETKGDKNRMDPASICAWLAQFAGAPAEHLKQIPGGVKSMLKALMELTGLKAWQLTEELEIMGNRKPNKAKIQDKEPLAGEVLPLVAGHKPEVPPVSSKEQAPTEGQGKVEF